jgi:CBS domain-containing protein
MPMLLFEVVEVATFSLPEANIHPLHSEAKMNVKDLMSQDMAYCTEETPLHEIAQMMRDHDCGMIPVVNENGSRKPIGAITDRDIVMRCVAENINPLDCTASDVMTEDPITISASASEQEAEKLMAHHKVRRLIVMGDDDEATGVISQADLARNASPAEMGEMLREVSEPFDRSRS